MRKDPRESDSAIDRKLRKRETASREGLCHFCPPHGGENASRKPAHGEKRPKYKNHRRKGG